MKAYKGFNKDMTCTPNGKKFQYAEGKTYTEDRADLCTNGFHACEAPIDCFFYYLPKDSVYHEVELEEVCDKRSDDSKLCGKKITIGAEIGIPGLVRAHFKFRKQNATMEHTDPNAASAGYKGAASAGSFGAASAGESGAASAGLYGAAVSRGSAETKENGLAVVRGNDVKVKGGLGTVLVIAEEESCSYKIANWKVAVVDGKSIKADTWYTLKNGEFVEVEDDG